MNNNISRLGFLMDKFNITGRELASALHVDYTLVSKWRNRTRILTPHSTYLKKMVEYFISLDSNIHHKTIKTILTETYPDAQLDTDTEIKLFLGKWLTSDEESDESNSIPFELMNNKHVIKGQYFIFKDNEGRREAILKFLDMALSFDEEQDLILFSQENANWFYEDSEFVDRWREYNLEFINRNYKMRVIHTVDRLYKSIASSLIRWLPLHMTGKTDSFYFPQFMDTPIKTTIYLLKNKAVILGVTVEGLSKEIFTYLCVDPTTVLNFQFIAQSLLERSLPLFDKYYQKQAAKLMALMAKSNLSEENNYYITTPPFLNVLSKELFRCILLENKVDDETSKACINYHSDLQSQFHNNCAEKYYRCIYDISRYKNMLTAGKIYMNELSMLTGQNIIISKDILGKCIEEMATALTDIPNFEIAIIEGPPAQGLENLDIWAKENTITLSSTTDSTTNAPFSLITNELTAVNSCYHQFNQIWNSIPQVQRDKNWVKQKLFQSLTLYKA